MADQSQYHNLNKNNIEMAENKGVKLIRPIPQRSNPPAGIPQQAANPILPLPSQNPLGAAPSNGLEGSLPIGSANLPINNFIYMLNRQNMPMTNTPGSTTLPPLPQKPPSVLSGIKRRKISEDSELLSEEEPPKRGKSTKREKNRQAAIECRKKRKEYVSSLEETIKKMEHEIYELKMKLNIYEQSEKFKVVSEKESIFSYLAGRDERYSNLEKQVQEYEEKVAQKEDTEGLSQKIQETVNSIHSRHGSKGVIRRQCTSYLFKKILTKIVPSHVRYLCSSCINENGYFQKIRGRKLAKSNNPIKERGKFGDFIEKTKDPETHIWKEVSVMGLDEEQIRTLKKCKAPVMKLRDKICKEMHKMLEIRKKLMTLSKEMEGSFDRVANIMTPVQQANFLLYIDKVKNKRELSIFELWGVKRNGFKITKRVRKDMQSLPTIKMEYDMIVGKKGNSAEESKEEEIQDRFMGAEVKKDMMERERQDSCQSNDIEWSVDSGVPESDTEEIE